MVEKLDKSLQERIERLEAVVFELQRVIKQSNDLSGQKTQKGTSPPPTVSDQKHPDALPLQTKPSSVPAQPDKKRFHLPTGMSTSEYWLNKIGIGLVLFGVAFLFKFSVDQGWLTPLVRLGFGVALGQRTRRSRDGTTSDDFSLRDGCY